MLKLNKIPLFLIGCVVIITGAFFVWYLTDSITKNNNEISFEKLFIVNIYGTQGEGYVHIEYDEEYLAEIVKKDGTKLLKEDVQYELTKENNLYNEDRFTLSISNALDLSNNGVNFDITKQTYTVKGLKEGTDFDVFKDFKIIIDGNKIVLDNNQCSNFVKDNVIFYIKNEEQTYKEGDTIIVGAHVDMNAATDNGYNIKVKEKEYIFSEQETNQ